MRGHYQAGRVGATPTMCAASYAVHQDTGPDGISRGANFQLLSRPLCREYRGSQDKVTLSNGDVVTGKVVSIADGKVTVQSPVMGDVVVSLMDVKDIVTGAPVTRRRRRGSGGSAGSWASRTRPGSRVTG